MEVNANLNAKALISQVDLSERISEYSARVYHYFNRKSIAKSWPDHYPFAIDLLSPEDEGIINLEEKDHTLRPQGYPS